MPWLFNPPPDPEPVPDMVTPVLHGIIREQQAEIRRLTDVIIELRREGFDPVAATVVPTQADRPKIPKEVRKAALRIAGAGTELYRELIQDAEAQLAAGEEVADVLKRIRFGAAVLDDDQLAD